MQRLRAHPVLITIAALVIAGVAVAATAAAYGSNAFAHAWTHLHPGWLALAIGAQLLAILVYVVAYRVLSQFRGGPRLGMPVVLRIVIAGFGPSAVGGGFALDKHALGALGGDADAATVRVLGLGALEWALLAPAAWISAVIVLATGDRAPMPSLTWPWAVAVPLGFALGLWLATPERRQRFSSENTRWGRALGKSLSAIGILVSLSREFSRCWAAWIGTALYWALDIAAFYACLRFIGASPAVDETVLAYATGYALTRRSIPLGGAGVTEVLMTFALHWVGQPVALALAAVVMYRLLNFALPALPALLVRPRVHPLVTAGAEGRRATARERRHAAARLGQLQR